jgi:ATP-dependent protease ClpP protease subunit
MRRVLAVFSLLLLVAVGFCPADTFTNKTKDIVYHGYSTQEMVDGQNVVCTQENGSIPLNLSEYKVEFNHTGRNNHVGLLSIKGHIVSEHETNAFIKALTEEANKGPLAILIEIDTPGGRVDLAKQLCAAIDEIRSCQTIAYITGGENGGAFSAGAAISLACDRIYMNPQTTIGAATMIATSSNGYVLDMKRAYGEAVGEKYNAAWRSYLASLAEKNQRSGALAKAMADKDIEVVEILRDGKQLFVESSDKRPNDVVVGTVCKKGELLAMPANKALACKISDGIVETRQALLSKLAIPGDATVIENAGYLAAHEEFEKVNRRFETLLKVLDLKFRELDAKQAAHSLTRNQALRDFEDIIRKTEYLLKLKKGYPDVPLEEGEIELFLNEIKAQYSAIKAMR